MTPKQREAVLQALLLAEKFIQMEGMVVEELRDKLTTLEDLARSYMTCGPGELQTREWWREAVEILRPTDGYGPNPQDGYDDAAKTAGLP